jgi:Glutamine phosphoribosylpyrophosphate amidotransferase
MQLACRPPNRMVGLCMAYFNGDYPTALYDYQAEYDAEIAQLQANHEGVIK